MCMKFGLVSYNVLKSPLCHHKKVGVFMVCISIMEFPSALTDEVTRMSQEVDGSKVRISGVISPQYT